MSDHIPIERAIRYYLDHGHPEFFDDLADHLRTGIVVARPTCFFMAKMIWLRVKIDAPVERAWEVCFYTGDLREMFSCFPWPLPWLVFWRRGKLRAHIRAFERFRHLAFRNRRETQ